MAIEIERKFLVIGNGWRDGGRSAASRQGYLSWGPPASVRVRVMGGKATLTIKEAVQGSSRVEFEYPIAVNDAEEMLDTLCLGAVVEKTRYWIEYAGKVWEVDQFTGANAPLLIAELELADPNETFACPPWLGDEVTGDARYYNASLSQHPYSTW